MNLAILGERNVERFGEYTAIVFEGRDITNVEQVHQSSRFASVLVGLGVAPGDRVAVMLPNSPFVPLSYGGILRCGAIVVPVVFLLAIPEITHIVDDCEAKVIITSPEFYPNVQAAIAPLAAPPIVVLAGGEPADPGVVSFEGLLAQTNDGHPIVDRASDDLAVISYTSGTTGRPKGVMLTHANLLFNAENSAKIVPTRDGDTSIACLPLAHLFGLGSTLVGQLFKIRGILLRWFTPDGFFDAVHREGAVSSSVVPAMLTLMLADPRFDDVDWSRFEWVVVGAAPLPAEVADEFEKRTGARVLQGYGLTETSPTVSVMRIDDEQRPGSCGRPAPDVDVVILDDDDRPLPVGEQGEVCVRGPNVLKGYYKLPEETARVMRGGWFHTGDVGKLDEDGFLHITERKKDMIIRGGFNIYPRDIEEILYTHPAVLEAAVVGVPDARMGEEVLAYVVRKQDASVTVDDLLILCRDQLAKYKTPRWIRFIDALPKNPIGKVLKKDLRERAAQESER